MQHINPLLVPASDEKFITIGEILLRLTPPNYEKIRVTTNFEASYGGSEANIALALANLGVDSTFFYGCAEQQSRKKRGPDAPQQRRPLHSDHLEHTGRDADAPARNVLSGNRIRDPRQQSHLRPEAQRFQRI